LSDAKGGCVRWNPHPELAAGIDFSVIDPSSGLGVSPHNIKN
jgi:hypothetical protein